MTQPIPRPGVLDISPYIPGSAAGPQGQKIFKLSSNESALGASPMARAAYRNANDGLHFYPDGSAGKLRAKIGACHGLNPDNIICGAGSDELLQLIARAYVGPGDNIIQTMHGFSMYSIIALSCGAEARFAPEKDLTTDVDEIFKLVDENTRVVFVANPNNPTGTYVPDTELRRLQAGLPKSVILVVDAAYSEFMEEDDYQDGSAMVEEFDNVVMTRTFSKIYGLSGIRLGWGYFPRAIADVVNRIRGPFNVSVPAIEAGIAAIEDQAFVVKNRDFNKREREKLAGALDDMGLSYNPSFGNFILVKFPETLGKTSKDILQHLTLGGVIVRDVNVYKLPEWLRISIGPAEGNALLINLLKEKFST